MDAFEASELLPPAADPPPEPLVLAYELRLTLQERNKVVHVIGSSTE